LKDCINRELSTLLHRRRSDASCSLTRWQYFFALNDVTTAILKLWRQIENRCESTTWSSLHSCQILSRSALKRRGIPH